MAALGAGLSLVGAGCSSTNACLDLACADSANASLTALAAPKQIRREPSLPP